MMCSPMIGASWLVMCSQAVPELSGVDWCGHLIFSLMGSRMQRAAALSHLIFAQGEPLEFIVFFIIQKILPC